MNAVPTNSFAWRAAWPALGLHTLGVFSSALFAYIGPGPSPDTIWVLWFLVDLPVSLCIVLFRLFGMQVFAANNYELMSTAYAIQFTFLGGLQYFLLVGWRWGRDLPREQIDPEPDISISQSPPDLNNPYTAPDARPSKQ